MAGAAAEMQNYLRLVIGVEDSPRPNVNARRDAIRNEGLSMIGDLVEFYEEDIKTLCASVRKPGGTIADPNNPNATIPNPGHNIPAIAEKRLRLACYGANLYHLLNRPITPDSLSRNRLRQFEQHRRTIEEHDAPEILPVISKTFGIMKALDLLPTHLRERLGAKKVALEYVIREDEQPAPLQALATNRVTSGNYGSLMDELVSRVPHDGSEFTEDNAKVYQVIQDMVAGSSHESSIKAHRRARDGRSAYYSLFQHNLGSSKWDRIIEDCETYLLRHEWNGRNHRFTLKMHIAKHRDAHNELTRASQYVTYELPNGHTRVSRLMKSITSKDASVVAAITHIQGTDLMRNNFENAADFLLLTAPTAKELQSGLRVSALETGSGKGKEKGKGKGKGDPSVGKTGVEFRYYKKREYGELQDDQKKELIEWRQSKKNKTKDEATLKISALETQMKEILSANKKLQETISALSTKPKPIDPLKNTINQRGDANQ